MIKRNDSVFIIVGLIWRRAAAILKNKVATNATWRQPNFRAALLNAEGAKVLAKAAKQTRPAFLCANLCEAVDEPKTNMLVAVFLTEGNEANEVFVCLVSFCVRRRSFFFAAKSVKRCVVIFWQAWHRQTVAARSAARRELRPFLFAEDGLSYP